VTALNTLADRWGGVRRGKSNTVRATAIECQCVMETSEQVESNRREMLARQRRQMIKKDSRAISPKLG